MGNLRGRRRAPIVAALLGLLLVLAGWQASADSVDETGYWWRFQPADGAPVSPPGVEPGQLYVAADAAGIAAIAAVRVDVGTAAVAALVLHEAASSGAPTLRACPTSGWSKTNGAGALRDAPSLDRCPGEGVAGTRTGKVWTFPVGDLVDKGVLDVAIATGIEPQSVTFVAPGVDAVQIAPPTTTDVEDDEVGGDDAVAAAPAPSLAAPAPTGNALALGALADLPSSGLAADVSSLPTAAFDDDVVGLPAPTRSTAPLPDGKRSPLALLAAALVIGAWAWRANAALGAARAHQLFGPLRFSPTALAGAGQVLAVAAQPGEAGPGAPIAADSSTTPRRQP